MRRIVTEALIIAVETALIVTLVATLGVPGGKQTNAKTLFGQDDLHTSPEGGATAAASDEFLRYGRSPPD